MITNDLTNDSPFIGKDGDLMIMAAHRYCLGRMTYISKACVDWIIQNADKMSQATLSVIARDTITAIRHDLAGQPADKVEWIRVVDFLWSIITPEYKTMYSLNWSSEQSAELLNNWINSSRDSIKSF